MAGVTKAARASPSVVRSAPCDTPGDSSVANLILCPLARQRISVPGPPPRDGLLSIHNPKIGEIALEAAQFVPHLSNATKAATLSRGGRGLKDALESSGYACAPLYKKGRRQPSIWKRIKGYCFGNGGIQPQNPARKGPWALPQVIHPTAVAPEVEPVFVHPFECGCEDFQKPCVVKPTVEQLEICALLELTHPEPADGHCRSTVGSIYHQKHGLARCVEVELWSLQQDQTPIGDTFGREFFRNSPQEHALLNRHLRDYFLSRERAQRTTPYSIPASQRHLLADLGMEEPEPDAPTVPHGLHKSLEESMLSRMAQYLPENNYGVISVKKSKLRLLPTPASIQNPVHQAKDASRYPGSGLASASFSDHNVYFMHDVSSEVGPHEIVERLAKDNGKAHVFVTGINPIEVVDRAGSFEPSSHEIDYDLGSFNFVFTGSEAESYYTPIGVTVAWLRTSSIRASNGKLYQVVLLEYKLGHCLWHIFQSDVDEQHTRTFPTGSYVRIPAVLTGTWQDEWLPTKLISAILSFTDRTPDLSTRNLAAKITQIATGTTPRLTSREQWVALHLAQERAPVQTWPVVLRRGFWRFMYAITLQWHLLAPRPDVYSYLDERRRYRVLHPTRGGGWTRRSLATWKPDAIPNSPSWLMRVSALTTSVFTYVIPKIIIGETLSGLIFHMPIWKALKYLFEWADIQPARVILTAAIVVVTAILPGHIVKVFSRLSGHYWRQLWLPDWLTGSFARFIAEVCGGPGARFLCYLPGRGWGMTLYVWTIGLLSVLPGLIPHWVLPWAALQSGMWPVLLLWYTVIVLENCIARLAFAPFLVSRENYRERSALDLRDYLSEAFGTTEVCHDVGIEPTLAHRVYFSDALWTVVVDRGNTTIRQVKFCLNLLGSWHAGQSNVDGVFTPLVSGYSTVHPVMKIRNVDRCLPSVVVLPARIPVAIGAPALAIDPCGMRFHEWLKAVGEAYKVETIKYPPLTPGQSCFWDCLSTLGGTPHMWYSWFMAYHAEVPDPHEIIGPVKQGDILRFSSASQIGICLTGTMALVTQSSSGWPVLNLLSSYNATAGMYHVEPAPMAQHLPDELALARVLCTIRNNWRQWFNAIKDHMSKSPVDSVPVPTASLRGYLGSHAMTQSRNGVLNALIASYSCNPIDFANQDGFAFPVTAPPDFNDLLIDFNTPVLRAVIGGEDSKSIWKRFVVPGSRFRVKVDPTFSHPAMEVNREPVIAGLSSERTWRNNVPPQPPRWRELQNDLVRISKPYIGLKVPSVTLEAERFNYTADVDRAARLVSDLRAHPSVLESFGNPVIIQSLDAIIDQFRATRTSHTVPIVAYFGVWGSGKTTATAEYMRALPAEQQRLTRVVSHTESLRAQSKLNLDFPNLRGYNFPTLASIITEPSTGPVVFDDAGKYWGGLLDLVILTNPLITEVVLNGDPAQGFSQFPVAGTQSQFDANPLAAVIEHVTKYATVTHRGFRKLADTLGVYTTNECDGHLTHTIGPKVGLPVLTSSPRYVQVLTSAGRQAYTFGNVQGEDFLGDVEIDMTALEDAILDRSAYVALTRSKTGCFIHLNAMSPDSKIRAPPTASDLMNALIYAVRSQGASSLVSPDAIVKAVFYKHLHTCMPALPWFADIGASLDRSLYQNVFPATTTTHVVEGVALDKIICEPTQPVAPPVDNFIRETHWRSKQDREINARGGATDQFKEVAFVNPHVHKRSDTATYFLSVQKRLKPMSAKANARRMARCTRLDMCNEYDKLVPEPPQWTALKHSEYCDRAINEYESSRTHAAVLAKLDAHEPDRTGADIRISLKGQVIKKDEKRHKVEAIPGQLIHEYDISVTIGDAPYALFLENELFQKFPPNFLFYRRMNPATFIEEYSKRWRVGNGVHTSDVTRWDVGCDAGVLNFDVHVMHRSGFPRDYIESYVERRLNSRSQHGPMATMQNSGDRYTWTLNSIRRAVVASLVNDVTGEDTVAINGDDAAVDRYCHSREFRDSAWEFKSSNGPTGEFSGYELGGPVPLYSAEGIHYRSLILESRDPHAQDKWVNYLDLLAWADLDSPLALDVARSAQMYLKPETFWSCLPPALHSHFL